MLNKLLSCIRRYDMVNPGDSVICAVSGGADSMALLWALYLLREKLGIRLAAAHFNHHLRGGESDRDEAFVRDFCEQFDIMLYVGSGDVVAGEKGLEAAAREARYAFFDTLPGKVATAHTADDNAETVLMHLVRGTGLKGLGAIAPVRGKLIRPLLLTTRQQVLTLLQEYHISYVCDSSNDEDQFLRNRLRHHVMPLLMQENPRLAQNLSAMALRLREDEQLLSQLTDLAGPPDVSDLRAMPRAQRARVLSRFLEDSGVREPGSEHIALAESLVFSDNPSARGNLPGGIVIARQYDSLVVKQAITGLESVELTVPGITEVESLGLRIRCSVGGEAVNGPYAFSVCTQGRVILRRRMAGDEMRLPGGTKSLKKLFIDRKIPAAKRDQIPVIADERGVLGVYGIGANLERYAAGVLIEFETVK